MKFNLTTLILCIIALGLVLCSAMPNFSPAQDKKDRETIEEQEMLKDSLNVRFEIIAKKDNRV